MKNLKDLVHLKVTLKLPILVVYYCTEENRLEY